MNPEILKPLLPISTPKTLRKGQLLFSEGNSADGFWLLEKGCVRLYVMGEEAREVEISRFHGGQIIGAALALTGARFPHFGQATEASSLRYFASAKSKTIIVHTPQLANFFLEMLAGKCSELTSRIASLQMQTVRERLLYYLGEACPKNASCTFRLPIPKRELAQQLGTSPETLSRMLNQLQAEGILQMNAREISMQTCIRDGRCRQGR